jgi:lysophospholipase L1-like esterase
MKQNIFSTLAILIGLIAALFLGEVILRIFGLGYGSAPLESDAIVHHKNPSNYRFIVHAPNNEYGGFPVYYDEDGRIANPQKVNNYNQRRDCRIAILGDSFAQATQVPYEKSFAGLLAQELSDKCSVANYGVSSYSPVLTLLQWKTKVRNYRPTHVFLLLYSNDVGDDKHYASKGVFKDGEIVAVPGPGNDILVRLLRKSYIVRLIRRLQLKSAWYLSNRDKNHEQQVVGGYVEEMPDLEPFTQDTIKKIIRQVQDIHSKFVLMVVPSKYRVLNEVMDNTNPDPEFSDHAKLWAERTGIDFLDLVGPFHGAARKKTLFFNKDIHFNENGNRVVFESIKTAYPGLFDRN